MLGEQDRDRLVDRHVLGALGDEELTDPPVVDRFDLHGRLVGFDLGDDVAGAHLIALADEPLGELALLHGGRERRHQELDGHAGQATTSVASSEASGSGS